MPRMASVSGRCRYRVPWWAAAGLLCACLAEKNAYTGYRPPVTLYAQDNYRAAAVAAGAAVGAGATHRARARVAAAVDLDAGADPTRVFADSGVEDVALEDATPDATPLPGLI